MSDAGRTTPDRAAEPPKYVLVIRNNIIPGIGGWSWGSWVPREKATRS